MCAFNFLTKMRLSWANGRAAGHRKDEEEMCEVRICRAEALHGCLYIKKGASLSWQLFIAQGVLILQDDRFPPAKGTTK